MDHNSEIKRPLRKPVFDPPSRPTPEELEATRAHNREWYIQAATELKAKAEAAVAELEARKATLTLEELKEQEAPVKAELARAEKEYQTMLESERPTAEELGIAERKIAGEKV